MTPAAVEIGLSVEYKTSNGHLLPGEIVGVIYGANPMKRANITHLVIQDWHSVAQGKSVIESYPNIVPIGKVRKGR